VLTPAKNGAGCNASLAGIGSLRQARGVNLRALQAGDAEAWDEAFRWLWPVVLAVAQLKLQPYFPNEAEDVAIEALEELVPKVREVKTVEELRPLAASIAHHRAVSLLRERFAKKRGARQTESLEAVQAEGGADCPDPEADSPVAKLEQKELAQQISQSLTELKPPLGEVLSDLFLHNLRYEEIARKHGLAVGSVGVYLKRGLEAIRRIWGPKGE
jgi:RNA polymerase sigma factor (sigma-70 family)